MLNNCKKVAESIIVFDCNRPQINFRSPLRLRTDDENSLQNNNNNRLHSLVQDE